MIAYIVNANCVTKPLGDKVKEIQSSYQTPRICQFLGLPKVNKEFWFDLSKPVRMKDLALQDIQKNIVKANQALAVTTCGPPTWRHHVKHFGRGRPETWRGGLYICLCNISSCRLLLLNGFEFVFCCVTMKTI